MSCLAPRALAAGGGRPPGCARALTDQDCAESGEGVAERRVVGRPGQPAHERTVLRGSAGAAALASAPARARRGPVALLRHRSADRRLFSWLRAPQEKRSLVAERSGEKRRSGERSREKRLLLARAPRGRRWRGRRVRSHPAPRSRHPAPPIAPKAGGRRKERLRRGPGRAGPAGRAGCERARWKRLETAGNGCAARGARRHGSSAPGSPARRTRSLGSASGLRAP
eukprot:SAG31_NODE_3093_length_4682_cov_47.973816_5_plen_226_part_00